MAGASTHAGDLCSGAGMLMVCCTAVYAECTVAGLPNPVLPASKCKSTLYGRSRTLHMLCTPTVYMLHLHDYKACSIGASSGRPYRSTV